MGFKQEEIDKLLVDTHRKCCLCRKLHTVGVHHIAPTSKGGTDDIDNAIPLCPNCHDEVHARPSPGRVTRTYTPEELKGHREWMIKHGGKDEEQREAEKQILSSESTHILQAMREAPKVPPKPRPTKADGADTEAAKAQAGASASAPRRYATVDAGRGAGQNTHWEPPLDKAEFEHWLRMDLWTLSEAASLLLGFEPPSDELRRKKTTEEKKRYALLETSCRDGRLGGDLLRATLTGLPASVYIDWATDKRIDIPPELTGLIREPDSKAEHCEDLMATLSAVPQEELLKWTGGTKLLTVAVVFTDIVDSTKLCNDLGDAQWERIRQQHFARAVSLIRERKGIVVKYTGDGILALFHSAVESVDFAVELHRETGHAAIQVRVGVHVGLVSLDGDDAYGRNVNLTARIMDVAKGDGVVVCDQVKQDITHRGESETRQLRWTELSNVDLKGFPERTTLWQVEG